MPVSPLDPPTDRSATLAGANLYRPTRQAEGRFAPIRRLRYHAHVWEPTVGAPPHRTLVLMHGWMDVGASFQFMVDALGEADGFGRRIVAPDWRGFGRTASPAADCYWFPDYLGDLDALLHHFCGDEPVDLLGHSMGGNVVMSYAGVRPERVRRLVNLEGFGMPATRPEQAPERLLQWLDELRSEARLQSYASLEEVAARLQKTNPLLAADKALWLAPHWAERRDDGRWHLQADPAHKRVNPILNHVPEVLEAWKRITAPLLWVEGDQTDVTKWWGHRYPRSDFEARLAVVPQVERELLSPAGHMLHHDQPEALARRISAFLR